MVLESTGVAEAFLFARLLFGGVLAFLGLNHLLNAEQMVGYSQAKGIPAAGVLVPASGLLLIGGGVGVAAGVFPVVAAGAIAGFLVIATVTMHDFWAVPDDQKQDEMTHFLKNTALVGGTLVLVALGTADWPYAVGIGLF